MQNTPCFLATCVVGIGMLLIPNDFHCRSDCQAESFPVTLIGGTLSDEQLATRLGWYDVSGGEPALITWASNGELLFIRPKQDLASFRLVPRSESLFDVVDASGSLDGTLAFGVGRSGAKAFHWLHESNHSTIGFESSRKKKPRQVSVSPAPATVFAPNPVY